MADQENQWKRDLQQAKKNSDSSPETETSEGEEGTLPLQPELLARNIDDDVIEEDPKSPKAEAAKMNQGVTNKIRNKTSNLLVNAWVGVISVIGVLWGLPYILFHFTMSSLGGPFARYFPKPGREWIKLFVDKAPLPQKFKDWTEETIGAVIGKFELMLTGCCCTSCIIPVLFVLIIIWMFANPCNSLKSLSSDIFLVAKVIGICD
jgi:hypothetical protein